MPALRQVNQQNPIGLATGDADQVSYQNAPIGLVQDGETYDVRATTGIAGSPNYLIRSGNAYDLVQPDGLVLTRIYEDSFDMSVVVETDINLMVLWQDLVQDVRNMVFMPPVTPVDLTSGPTVVATTGIAGSPNYALTGVALRSWPSQPVAITKDANTDSDVYPPAPGTYNTPVTI